MSTTLAPRGTRLPHRTRLLVRWQPHHIVLTVNRDVPPLHRRLIRELFNGVLEATSRKYPDVAFTAGTLMPDHVHLVAQPQANGSRISRAIQNLTACLARGINRAFGRKGAVFRDRFFSRALNTVSELVRVLRYIGMNPVKAGLVDRPEDWEAGSVRAYLAAGSKGTRDTQDGGIQDRCASGLGPWRFWGWMYRVLGFEDDPAEALRRILDGRRRPVVHRGGRQLRLPFTKGLPRRPR